MTEDFELDKQLYEVSHWTHRTVESSPCWKIIDNTPRIYRYTLEYLLDKLSASSERNLKIHYSVIQKRWFCGFAGYGSAVSANTPRQAALKLAIELFKQGILKPAGE